MRGSAMKFVDENLYLNYTELYTNKDTAAMEKLDAQEKAYSEYFNTVICPAFSKAFVTQYQRCSGFHDWQILALAQAQTPRGGPKKVPIPGRKDGSKGWVDKNGNVWYPDKLHNGSDSEHWDVVDKNGKNHRNVYPDGRQDHDSSSKISLDNLLNSILDLFIPTNDVVTIICILIPIILFLFFLLIVGLPILLPIFI